MFFVFHIKYQIHLLRTLFLVEVSSGKFLPVSQSQKAGTARHSRLMKRMSDTWITPGLTRAGHMDCITIRLYGQEKILFYDK